MSPAPAHQPAGAFLPRRNGRCAAQMVSALPGRAMSDPSLTIRPETAADADAIERLHERTFGPGRYAKTAYRLREGGPHALGLSVTARSGSMMVGAGEAPRRPLDRLRVGPPFRSRGVGLALMERALADARAQGHRLVALVGDEPYYGRARSKRRPQ